MLVSRLIMSYNKKTASTGLLVTTFLDTFTKLFGATAHSGPRSAAPISVKETKGALVPNLCHD